MPGKATTEQGAQGARDVRYPSITAQLTGNDGNVFRVLGTVIRALRTAGISEVEIQEFQRESTSGDYNHALATCMKWVDCK